MAKMSINLLRQNYLLIFLRQNFGNYFIWARASTVGVFLQGLRLIYSILSM